jgi:hypothetical protein
VGWEQTRWRLVFLLFKEMRGLTNWSNYVYLVGGVEHVVFHNIWE